MKAKTLLRIVPASEAKNNFGQLIKRVYEDEEAQIIERAGLPVAAVVPISDLERIYPDKVKALPRAAVGAKRERAWRRLKDTLGELQQSGASVSEEEVEADVARAVHQVRHGRPR